MHDYIHNANIDLYRRLIAESECDPKRDDDRHKTLLKLLDEETAKDNKSNRGVSPSRSTIGCSLASAPGELSTNFAIGRHLNSDRGG
jgi:hypothetical protein